MNWDEYIEFTKSTAIENSLAYIGLKLNDKYGDFCNSLSLDKLGDFCWYVAEYHRRLGLDPQIAWECRSDSTGDTDLGAWIFLGKISETIGKITRQEELSDTDKQRLTHYGGGLMSIVFRCLCLVDSDTTFYLMDNKLAATLEQNKTKLEDSK